MRAWKLWSWAHSTRLRLTPSARTLVSDDSAGSTRSTLKGELRRLYKLIHPDLLHNQPIQQETNQKSFQLLQEYLMAAKGGDGSKRHVYHFKFYIRGKAKDESFEKVEVSLPAPQSRGRFHREQEILPATKSAIGQLFAACGLSINLTWKDERSSLPSFLQEASELQRQNEASQVNMQQQLSIISNALYLGRGVRVLFRPPVEETHLAVQVELLEGMAKAMDASPGIKLCGSTFILGNCYKVDVLGRIWLNCEDSIESWTQFISKADFVTASLRRAGAKSQQVEEEKVAQLMGVALVVADYGSTLHPDYSLFLQRMRDGATEHGAVGGGRFSELPVRVGEVKVPLVDENMGCVVVSSREEFSTLYKFIEQCGNKALEHQRKLKLRERRLEDLRKHVRMKLRLRHLTFDQELSPDQLMSACTKLSNHAPKLAMYTEGLSLCISKEYQLPKKGFGNFVHMKWDFSPDDLW